MAPLSDPLQRVLIDFEKALKDIRYEMDTVTFSPQSNFVDCHIVIRPIKDRNEQSTND